VDEAGKLSLHISLTPKAKQDRIKDFAECIALEGFIEGHPHGNFSQHCQRCLSAGGRFFEARHGEEAGIQMKNALTPLYKLMSTIKCRYYENDKSNKI